MSSGRGVLKNFLVATMLLAYIVVSIMVVTDRRSVARLERVAVAVLDSVDECFVTASVVDSLIGSSTLIGKQIDQVDLFAIENIVSAQPYVAWCNVSSDIRGIITIRLTQRMPIVRMISESGYDFYMDSTLHVLKPDPICHKNVPIVSGNLKFGFTDDFYGELDQKNSAKDIEYLKKLINFVEFIDADEFLRDFVMQIYVEADRNIVIAPRLGSSVIAFGGLADFSDKLSKVKAFYMQCYGTSALDSVKRVDVRYAGQVIIK